MQNNSRDRALRQSRARLAVAGTALTVFLVTLAGAWVEARWPNAVGTYITAKPRVSVDPTRVLWQLRRVDGVGDAVAVFRSSLEPDEVKTSDWTQVWFYANQTDTVDLAFLPPDPKLVLGQGRFPAPDSLSEAVLAHELAQALRKGVGDTVTIRYRPFRVVGVWEPSARVPGNFAQITAVAAEAILPPDNHVPYQFIVFPADEQDATQLARRIWQRVPDLELVSPDWELAQALRERAVLLLVLGGAIILALLFSWPLLNDLAHTLGTSPTLVALMSGAGGCAAAWATTLLINQYAAHTLGLTPCQMTWRLGAVVLTATACMGQLASRRLLRWSMAKRWVATATVLALCGTGVVAVGTLSESLHVSLDQAQLVATDWVAVPSSPEDKELVRTVHEFPGVRGYVIEAYGGLANEDEERWLGPWPASGVLYGLHFAGGEGTLSVPYRTDYWRGHALDPDGLYEAVIGYDLAQDARLNVGDVVTASGHDLLVVGIRERLLYESHRDSNHRIDVSLETLRRVLDRPLVSVEMTLLVPPAEDQAVKGAFLQEMSRRLRVSQVLTVEDRLAEAACGYPGARTLTPANAETTTRRAKTVYSNVLLLCGIVLLSVSALAVAGAVAVRLDVDQQRLSLSKAMGVSEGTLFADYVQKGTVLGVVGGLMGVLGGWAISTTLNGLAVSGSTELLFTPRLGAGVFFFVALTAVAAAIAPASLAARQDAGWLLYGSAVTETVTSGGSES